MDEGRLAGEFAGAVLRSTYDWVDNKVNLAREKKTIEEKQNAYENIINNLLNDKMEIERIAGEYKSLYEKVSISDEDIEHLQKTIQNGVQLLSQYMDITEHQTNIDLMIGILNKDAIKTMQLLGFNYKEAIGEPLTEVCASSIKSKLGEKTKQPKSSGGKPKNK